MQRLGSRLPPPSLSLWLQMVLQSRTSHTGFFITREKGRTTRARRAIRQCHDESRGMKPTFFAASFAPPAGLTGMMTSGTGQAPGVAPLPGTAVAGALGDCTVATILELGEPRTSCPPVPATSPLSSPPGPHLLPHLLHPLTTAQLDGGEPGEPSEKDVLYNFLMPSMDEIITRTSTNRSPTTVRSFVVRFVVLVSGPYFLLSSRVFRRREGLSRRLSDAATDHRRISSLVNVKTPSR